MGLGASLRYRGGGTLFGPRLHAVATFLKIFQALSYERLQAALSDLFGLMLSHGSLMSLLRRALGFIRSGRDVAISALREAAVVACDETRVRIEGSNAYHWLFHSAKAAVHTASPICGAIVVPENDGGPPADCLDLGSPRRSMGLRRQAPNLRGASGA